MFEQHTFFRLIPDPRKVSQGKAIFIVRSRNFKCSLTNAKKSFYRSANAIFGKTGRTAPEEATLELVSK